MPLSDSAIRKLQPRERRYKKADQRGLYIEVEPTGSKLWRWKYHYHGREKRISLGRFPEVSIAMARRKQEDARRLLQDGKDPSLERQKKRLTAAVSAETHLVGSRASTLKSRWSEIDARKPQLQKRDGSLSR